MIPVEAEVISPSVVAGRTLDEVQGLNVYQGKVRLTLADHFDVSGEVIKDEEAEMRAILARQ